MSERRRGPAPEPAVPRPGCRPRTHPVRPGRELPRLARRRRGRRAKAPAALGGGLAVTVEPLRELTAAQLWQLDGEVGLVGTVMEATATLTVGPETAQLCCR